MAKHSKDIMHVIERRNKHGELSFELHCSGKDPLTRKNKVYVKTFKVSNELKGVKEIATYRLKVQAEFKEEVAKKSLGTIIAKKENIRFIDFATEWVDDILKLKKLSHNYYRASKERLEVVKEKLGYYYLHEISPAVIKNFCKWLVERTYEKAVVTVKESLQSVLAENKMPIKKLARECGISHATLFVALRVGERIEKENAVKLCEYLNIPINKYFSIEIKKVPYAQSSNKSLKSMVHSVLQEAVRQELIERNYASRGYTDNIKGAKNKREIFNDGELQRFIKYIETETDIRKKVAFSMYVNLGLRNCELAGLEWQDISLETSEVKIQRNCLYVGSEFGIITKETKTKNSNRTISIPNGLLKLLKEYKIFWNEQKINHGDLWEHTDRLFCQNNGKDMAGSTIADWLKQFEQQNGLKHVTPHGLRHTHITTLIKNGIDVRTVSGRVGHANVTTTLDIYSHFTKEADRQAANKLDELFATI